MDDFLSGFMGVGLGFVIFLPSYFFTRQAVEGEALSSAPLTFRVSMFMGMAIMISAPIIFWGLVPMKNHIIGEDTSKENP